MLHFVCEMCETKTVRVAFASAIILRLNDKLSSVVANMSVKLYLICGPSELTYLARMDGAGFGSVHRQHYNHRENIIHSQQVNECSLHIQQT